METITVKSISNPQHLMDWFEARGYQNVVLSVADAKQLGVDWQRMAIHIALVTNFIPDDLISDLHLQKHLLGSADESIKSCNWLLTQAGRDGYLIWPIKDLRKLPMPALQMLQDLVFEYRDFRRANWKPIKIESCECKGRNNHCNKCNGSGSIEVLVEMSEEEQRLATVTQLSPATLP